MTERKKDFTNQESTTSYNGLQFRLFGDLPKPINIDNREDALVQIKHELEKRFTKLQVPIDPFPNYKTLACACYSAKKDKPNAKTKLQEDFLTKWSILCTVQDSNSGYHGCVCINKMFKQIIVAHRGTELLNSGSLEADMDVMKNRYTPQALSACAFLLTVSEALIQTTSTAGNGKWLYSKLNEEVQVSVTGHSLGGWLAQISTFAAKYFDLPDSYKSIAPKIDLHFHCVAFDSPGAKNILQKLEQDLLENNSMDRLDITVILGNPNPVNIINQHAGQVLRLELPNLKQPKISKETHGSSIASCLTLLPSHKLENFLETLNDENFKIRKILPLQWPLHIVDNWNTNEKSLKSSSGFKTYKKGVKQVIGPEPNQITKILIHYFEGTEIIEDSEFNPNIFKENIFNDLGLSFFKELKRHWYWNKYFCEIEVEEFCHKEMLNGLTFNLNYETEITDLKILSEINRVSSTTLKTLQEINDNLPNVNGVLLLLESDRYISEMKRKYLEVGFSDSPNLMTESRQQIWTKTFSVDIRIYGDKNPEKLNKYIDYIRLHVINSLQKNNGDFDMWTLAIISSDWLNNIVCGVPNLRNFRFTKNLKYLIVDCLEENNLNQEVIDLIDRQNSEPETNFKVILLLKACNSNMYNTVNPSLEENFVQSQDFRNRNITFQGREVPLRKVFTELTAKKTDNYFHGKLSSLMFLLEKKREVVIGKHPPSFFDNDNNYVFCNEDLELDQFTKTPADIHKNSYFFVAVNSKDLAELEQPLNVWKNLTFLKEEDKFLNGNYKDLFKTFCREYSEKFVYLLEYMGNSKLILKYCYSPYIYKTRHCKPVLANTNKIKPLQCDDDVLITFEEGLKLDSLICGDKVKVLIDEPGMGKSTTLMRMVEEYFIRNPDIWVISLDLKCLNIPSFNEQSWLNDFIMFLLKISIESHANETEILNMIALDCRIANNPEKLAIFLDSFDEILSTEDRLHLINFLTHLKKIHPQITIVLSTRTHEYDKLSSNAHFEFFKFIEIENQANFLYDIWNSVARILFDEVKVKDELLNYASKVIEEASSFLKSDLGFLAAPLQLEMLSTINLNRVIKYLKRPTMEIHFPKYSVVNIYKKYIKKKFRIYQSKKFGLALEKEIHSRLISSFEEDLKCLAVRLLCKKAFKPLIGKCITKTVEVQDNPHYELLLTGIVVSFQGNKLEFSHRTFADFYLAQVVFQNLRDCLAENYYEEARKLEFSEFLRNLLLENKTHNIFQGELLKSDTDLENVLTVPKTYLKNYECIPNLFIYSLLFPFSSHIILQVTEPFGEIQYIKNLVSKNLHELFIYSAFPFLSAEVRKKISAAFKMFNHAELIELQDIECSDFYSLVNKWLGISVNWVEHLLRFYNFKRDSVFMRLLGCQKFRIRFLEYHFNEVMSFLYPKNDLLNPYRDVQVNVIVFIKHCMGLLEIKESSIHLIEGETTEIIENKLYEEIIQNVVFLNTIENVAEMYSNSSFKGKLNLRKLAEVLMFKETSDSFGYLQFKQTVDKIKKENAEKIA